MKKRIKNDQIREQSRGERERRKEERGEKKKEESREKREERREKREERREKREEKKRKEKREKREEKREKRKERREKREEKREKICQNNKDSYPQAQILRAFAYLAFAPSSSKVECVQTLVFFLSCPQLHCTIFFVVLVLFLARVSRRRSSCWPPPLCVKALRLAKREQQRLQRPCLPPAPLPLLFLAPPRVLSSRKLVDQARLGVHVLSSTLALLTLLV